MKNKLLVTGANGVLGKAITSHRQFNTEYDIVSVGRAECDLTCQKSVADFLQNEQPKYIVHLAAISGGIGLSSSSQATLLRDNMLMAINIADSAVELGINKVIFTLSAGMYPEDSPLPITELSNLTGKPHQSAYGYGYAKSFVEPLIYSYNHQYNTDFIGLVPNGIFGYGDRFGQPNLTMLPSLVYRGYRSLIDNQPFLVWGDGTPMRQYTWSEDLADIYYWALKNYSGDQILNIGTNEELSIKDIVATIVDSYGIDSEQVSFDTTKPKGIHRRPLDNSRFTNLLNYKYTPMKTGIQRLCDYVKTHSI